MGMDARAFAFIGLRISESKLKVSNAFPGCEHIAAKLNLKPGEPFSTNAVELPKFFELPKFCPDCGKATIQHKKAFLPIVKMKYEGDFEDATIAGYKLFVRITKMMIFSWFAVKSRRLNPIA